jgi:hypothetical protein
MGLAGATEDFRFNGGNIPEGVSYLRQCAKIVMGLHQIFKITFLRWMNRCYSEERGGQFVSRSINWTPSLLPQMRGVSTTSGYLYVFFGFARLALFRRDYSPNPGPLPKKMCENMVTPRSLSKCHSYPPPFYRTRLTADLRHPECVLRRTYFLSVMPCAASRRTRSRCAQSSMACLM